MLPNTNQSGDLTRHLLQILATCLATYGGLSESIIALIVGIAGMFIPIIWGLIRNTRFGQIVAAAETIKDDGGKILLPNAAEAAAIPSANVIPAPQR